jgi:wyosine [tRNA(Phe)-imidazoG37] synthetase (radical SAM superfamily)
MASRPKLLLASPEGEVYEHPTFELALDNGLDLVRPGKKDLIPVPMDWDLMIMPGTLPIGYDPDTGTFQTVETFEVDGKTFTPRAVALHPPPGYVRNFHPGAKYLDESHPDEKFKKLGGGVLKVFQDEPAEQAVAAGEEARPGLPLWAYTAVGHDGRGRVAAMFLADETTRWAPDLYYQGSLEELVDKRLAADPDNAILKQLASCATEYLCCCAQNIFYERWEGAIPSAPACTASCLGCLSKDPAFGAEAPQKRLKFSPDAEQLARVMAHHLEVADEAMVSFGQGCEGEPTMYGDALVDAVRLTRNKTDKGVININTNGSRPQVIRDAAAAGAGALRISINTFDPDVYTAYYRPADYTFDTVMESLYAGRDGGMYVSINLLIWPGWTDRLEELEKISKIVDDGALQMIQLRNLCVDPGHFRTVLPPREERGVLLGLKKWVEMLHERHPHLRFGTFNPRLAAPWYDDVPPWVGARPAA